jgi:hypothetical protein
MELIKRKRSIENYVVRYVPERLRGEPELDINAPDYFYGKIPDFKVDSDWKYMRDANGNDIPNTVDIDVFLTQDFDDMGIFTDAEFSALTPYLTQVPANMVPFNSFVYGRFVDMVGTATTQSAPLSFYTPSNKSVNGTSDDANLRTVESYILDTITELPDYDPGLNLAEDITIRFDGVIAETPADVTYILGGDADTSGNFIPNTGVRFITFKNEYINTEDQEGNPIRYRSTNFYSPVGGINNNNVILSALTKQEEYSGIVFKPEVESEVFIDRGVENIFEKHAMLSEIKTTNDIDNNRGGFLST